jgi:hypothetical protein
VRFVVTNGAGLNVGLAELQVFAGDNVARDGTLTTSSQADLGPRGQLRATDGAPSEWVSTQTNPWIQVRWVNPHTVDRVVLFDRVSTASNVNGGTLTFSDGTSVAVSGVPSNGAAKVVAFAPKTVTWVRFQAAGGAGAGNGLAELRVLSAGNLASSAVATGTSTTTADPGLGPSAATDGVVNQWFVGEWASNGELNPRFRLTWTTPQRLGQVVLYDRNNLTDHAPRGTLVFSDGSQVAVGGIDNTGVGQPIVFAPRTVTWVEFQVAGGSGLNVGLSEVEAFGSNGIQRVESFDRPASFVRHQNGLGRLDPYSGLLADFQFRVVAGLADPRGVSFESVNYPGQFLRHQNSVLKLNAFSDTRLYRQDATFHPVPGLAQADGWVSYRSDNFPSVYLSHDAAGALGIAPPSATGAEATFRTAYLTA